MSCSLLRSGLLALDDFSELSVVDSIGEINLIFEFNALLFESGHEIRLFGCITLATFWSGEFFVHSAEILSVEGISLLNDFLVTNFLVLLARNLLSLLDFRVHVFVELSARGIDVMRVNDDLLIQDLE